jgi:putative membrane protein
MQRIVRNARMPLKYLLTAIAVATALLSPGTPEAQPPAPPTSNMPATNATLPSQEFANKAAISGLYEIEAARIAEQRSPNPDIDRFAAQMIRDHGRNNLELKATAARIGLRLPTRLDAQHLGLIAQLRSANAGQFNATYAQQQVQGHQDAIAIFTSYARSGGSAQLERFARKSLPVLEHHLEMAQALPTGSQMARSR